MGHGTCEGRLRQVMYMRPLLQWKNGKYWSIRIVCCVPKATNTHTYTCAHARTHSVYAIPFFRCNNGLIYIACLILPSQLPSLYLGLLTNLRKMTIIFVMSVCLSVLPFARNNSSPLYGFSSNLIFESFQRFFERIQV